MGNQESHVGAHTSPGVYCYHICMDGVVMWPAVGLGSGYCTDKKTCLTQLKKEREEAKSPSQWTAVRYPAVLNERGTVVGITGTSEPVLED